MISAQQHSDKPTAVRALIITLLPERLRSSNLLETHLNSNWLNSSICLGIPTGNSREHLESEIQKVGLPKPPDKVYDILSLSEVACIYAHLKALAIAAKSDVPTLILEDDATFDPAVLRKTLKNLDWIPEDTILKLEGHEKPGGRIVFGPNSKDFQFALSMRPTNGGAGYLVTPLSASRMLDAAYGYGHAIDMLLNDPTLHGCFLLDAVPYVIKQSAQTDSTITRGKKRSGLFNKGSRHMEKLRRRLGRYWVQLKRAKQAGFSRVRFAKFYEN